MRQLPLGLPKIMVSTLASGDVSPYVDISDIVMMPSVTDMAGLNRLSRVILHNAAQAIAGMARPPASSGRRQAGARPHHVRGHHALRYGNRRASCGDGLRLHGVPRHRHRRPHDGKACRQRPLAGVIDITTTEVCDLLLGGVLPATEDRFGAIARTKLPYVGSVGALDMVNFWAPETVPEQYAGPASSTATTRTSR